MTSRRRIVLWTAAVAVTLAAVAVSLAVTRCDDAPPMPDVSAYSIRGIDISRHNGEHIDFEAVRAAGYSFVYIKATEGTDFKDPYFIDNIRRARQAGLHVGLYHFFRFDTDGEMQAINLMESLAYRRPDLPVAIDIEEWGNPDGHATSQIVARLRRLLDTLDRYGVPCILYTNKDGYERFVRGNFDSYPLWISSFTTPDADIAWDIWQYTHRGSVDGITGPVDLNVARH